MFKEGELFPWNRKTDRKSSFLSWDFFAVVFWKSESDFVSCYMNLLLFSAKWPHFGQNTFVTKQAGHQQMAWLSGGGGGRLSQRHLKALIGRLLCYCLDAQEPLSSCLTFLHQIVFLNKSCFYLIKVCLYQRCNDLFSPQFSPNLHFWVTVLFWLDIHPTYITKQAFSRVTLSLA